MSRRTISVFLPPACCAALAAVLAPAAVWPAAAWGVQLVDPEAVAVATDAPGMDSVLIETRQGAPLDEEDTPDLEPISEVSDFEPELADPESQGFPSEEGEVQPAEALEEADTDTAPPRVASRDGDRVAADVAAAYKQRNQPRPAKFHGVVPGQTTREELVAAWGDPNRLGRADGETAGGEVLQYDLEPFNGVQALVESELVSVVRVELAEQATVGELCRRLKLTEIEPVDVIDPATGELLAVTYPEKGLTLLTKATGLPADGLSSAAGVSHLVLEPIDARAFVLRAEQRPADQPKARLADLATAASLQPVDPHTHWLASVLHVSVGQAEAAQAAAAEAVRLEPISAAYRCGLAKALAATGEFDEAVLETRRVLDDPAAPEVVRAEALYLMGRLASLGERRIARKAVDFHNASIAIADTLATDADDRQRRLAKDLLVAAHLAVAEEIAKGDYADKGSTVAEWVGRASELAEQRIASDQGGLELRLEVARGALAALAELRPTKDPSPWLDEAQETADSLLADATDPLFRARVHWELGEAYQHAVRIEHVRGDAAKALEYGSRAITELSAGAEPRTTSPAAEKLVGRLYFYLGAVNAVHRTDHDEAIGWYDKGRGILAEGPSGSEFVIPRRDGEELVSMGVSYWEQGQKEMAVDLTETGARLMERGVSAGVLGESTLAVPYGNLATMYKLQQNATKASEYNRLARGVRPEDPPATAAAGSKPAAVAKTDKPKARVVAAQQTSRPAPASAQPAPASDAPRVSGRLRRPTPRQTFMR
ncbi:hypothetical protein [Botrimarina sp.]|uniref:hypothetical protein n=1 Tax=Botrimarina sp. TaxID=2795802 RepID=UPI0032EC26B8